MSRAKRYSLKKVLILIGLGVAIALAISVLLFISRDFLRAHISLYLAQALMTSVVVLAKTMIYVFIIGGVLMALIIHWVGWENIKFKIKQSHYRSFLYAKDYYQEYKRVKYENFVGDLARFHDSKLETGGPELDERLVGSPASAPPAGGISPLAYKDRRLSGVIQSRYSNGSLESEVSYKNGIVHGPYVTYYPSGRMHNEKFYRDGSLNGTFRAWDEDGHLFFEIDYKDNKQHGLDKIYYRTGVLQFEDVYVEGKRTQRKTFDERGRLKFVQDFN